MGARKYDAGKVCLDLVDEAFWRDVTIVLPTQRGDLRALLLEIEQPQDALAATRWAAMELCEHAPYTAMYEQMGRVLTFGAEKYDEDNWRKGMDVRRPLRAAQRHYMLGPMRGEVLDPESGLPHLAHVGCCMMFAWSYLQ